MSSCCVLIRGNVDIKTHSSRLFDLVLKLGLSDSSNHVMTLAAGHHRHEFPVNILKRMALSPSLAKEENRANKRLPPPYVLMLRKMALSYELVGSSTSQQLARHEFAFDSLIVRHEFTKIRLWLGMSLQKLSFH
ncbi:hypothetical protein F2Q69_00022187 [Brassica cretica]|uniref:Uncharacterized protein n=1 Tax=Brassica cretica TaxID=69181 RepID=A0A8S9Q6X9_BRACR|nr:hypothetical protein F2Q69_00022187 [Brassica cretica]